MSRFVSALGPDVEPGEPDVKYHRSAPNYPEALILSQVVRKDLGESQTSVIYRLSYDPTEDAFFSWRQPDGSLQGDEKNPKDNTESALAYEIFSAPMSLLDSEGGQRLLSEQVYLIATHSQRPPGNAGPP
jgi:hypothetical protein